MESLALRAEHLDYYTENASDWITFGENVTVTGIMSIFGFEFLHWSRGGMKTSYDTGSVLVTSVVLRLIQTLRSDSRVSHCFNFSSQRWMSLHSVVSFSRSRTKFVRTRYRICDEDKNLCWRSPKVKNSKGERAKVSTLSSITWNDIPLHELLLRNMPFALIHAPFYLCTGLL